MRYLFITLLTIQSFNLSAQQHNMLWTAAWSPDDKYIAVGGDQGELKLFDSQTFKLVKAYPVEDVLISRLKWHPHENKLAVITQSTSFKAKILNLDTDKWVELEGLESSIRGLDWNYNGEYLAVSEMDGEISIFTKDGKKVSRFMADPKSVTGIDWHPTKNILTAVGSQIGIFSHLGDTLKTFEPRDNEVFLLCVEWHPSGKYFATGDYGELESGMNKLIQYWDIDGKKLAETSGKKVEYRNIRWSPDGKELASANDALSLWDTNGILIKASNPSEDYLWGLDWNSDGTKIVTTSSHGEITIWNRDLEVLKRVEY